MFEDILGDLNEDDVVLHGFLLEFLAADSQDDVAFSFVLVDGGGFGGERELVGACGEGVEALVEVVGPEEARQFFFEVLVDDLPHLFLAGLGLDSER